MDPKYRLGITELDDQHEAIEKVFFALQDAFGNRDRWHVLHYILEDLYQKLTFHFAFEEAVMRMFAYPDKDGHAAIHAELLETVERYRKHMINDVDAQKPPIEPYYERILTHDTHFAAFIRDIKARAGIAESP